MAGKDTLLRIPIFSAAMSNTDMSTSLSSAVTNIKYMDNIAIQLAFTGTPTGTFLVQLNLDSTSVWAALPLSPVPVAQGGPDLIILDLNQLSAEFIQVIYNRTSGSGTIAGWISAKMV